ncbi:Acyl-CoA synthetase (NDP forming) [Corynebacterium camporealensis]|uniref:Acyl-CoA synthetase (NDP forming) n=1 Tax=Corynebacterium camporealensis TaxID=161896 RepID=A0A0F6QW59_9CORY|nr:GNAT family N-acetyltransferase [Corynebacterium camporealensis]AKE38785.1 acyl-CoA synthetase (NDP forming) [Corynebacterium camporealensis]AVH88060.1 Acyl-CoA synthetase (NDP forming) [Corynebacterium camporealensis]
MDQKWEADVILNDGDIATLRAIRPEDRDAIEAFFGRVSEQSKYLRFFGTHPTLTDDDWKRWMDTKDHDKVTLVMVERNDIVAVAGYDLIPQFLPDRVADVSFLVQDSHHSKGVGNILLEHLAEIGREGEISRFYAEMLTQNRQMVQVFIRAGYSVHPELADGYIVVDFSIAPNEKSRDVMERRELRAEANSIGRLMRSEKVAVIGTPALPTVDGAAYYDTVDAADASCDVIVCDYDQVDYQEVLDKAAELDANGVIFLARAHNPPLDPEAARATVLHARDVGLRALGPAALGIINTHTPLNLTPGPLPRQGHIGIFTQSAGVATLVLSRAISRGCGISNFLAVGSFADVSGNDVMQFWSVDEDTNICLLSLDAIGNPRKFFRILRRLALEKHVIIFIPSRALTSARESIDSGVHAKSPKVLDSVIRSTGVMVVNRRETMFDIAQLLARQPLVQGPNVALISNSAGLSDQMAAAAERFGLKPHPQPMSANPQQDLPDQIRTSLEDPNIDAVLCAVVEFGNPLIANLHPELDRLAASTTDTPLIASYIGFNLPATNNEGPEEMGQLPIFATYADALEALAEILHNEERRQQARPKPEDEPVSGNKQAVEEEIAAILKDSPQGRWADDVECTRILEAYGINIVPWTAAPTLDDAKKAGEETGWDAVLKCASPIVRGRSELPTVFRHITTPSAMEQAWHTIEELVEDLHLGSDPEILEPVVQRTVTSGPSLTIRAVEDPVIGPMVSAGISGLTSDLLDDQVWRVPPLRPGDIEPMLSELKAHDLLSGYQGTKASNLEGIEDIVTRLSQLKDDFAAIVDIELTPVIVAVEQTHVVGARMRIAPLDKYRDPLARSIS